MIIKELHKGKDPFKKTPKGWHYEARRLKAEGGIINYELRD